MEEEKPEQVTKKRKRYKLAQEPVDDSSGDWLLTYADMMTLLMAFFVLLWSMSFPDPGKFDEMMKELSLALGSKAAGEAFGEIKEETLESIMKKIEAYIKNENLTDDVFITQDPRGVVIYAGSKIAFESGETELLEPTEIILKNLSKILKKSTYKIVIESHTDDVPLRSRKFPSNWELSANRAGAVARYLINTGNISPSRLIPSGYAGFKPRFPPTPENRAKNQRLEIVILREKF